MLRMIALLVSAAIAMPAAAFELSSDEVRQGGTIGVAQVYNDFGCTGKNVSPSLTWQNPPVGTRSYAVTVYDPDAPTGSGWWHWVVFNIPPTMTSLPSGAGDASGGKLPAGVVQSRTDFGKPGYGGPCPPKGDKPHRYIFTVYALKVEHLDLDANASGAMVGYMLNANKIRAVSITSKYGWK
jgi:Raf kinase inhibitor-like YbhB/YbcL family protein